MKNPNEIVNALTNVKIFKSLEPKILTKMAEIAKYKEVERGNYLFLEKQKGNNLFVLLQGVVDIEIMLPNETQMKTIATLRTGDVLGELALAGINHRSASAKAMEPVRALFWDVNELSNLFEQDKEIGYAFMRNLAKVLGERIITTNKELGNALYQLIYQF